MKKPISFESSVYPRGGNLLAGVIDIKGLEKKGGMGNV